MITRSIFGAGALAFALLTASAAHADTLQKIADTRTIVMGVRDSGAPLSYSLGDGRYSGYHVELCERIVAGLQRELKLPQLAIKYQVVSSSNRIPLVQNGGVDMECGTTSNNTARLGEVAFALTTFVTEVRMAVNAKSGITSVAQLDGKNVTVTTGSTAVKTLRLHKKAASINFQEVYGKDTGDSFLLLETGRADAMVDDDNILAGNIAAAKNPADFRIVGETLAVEPIAIMIRKNDAAFKKVVDQQIEALMKSGELGKIYEKWFISPIPPRNVSLNLPMSATLRKLVAAPNDLPAEAYLPKQ
ncbi:amino acid ABC transporter substrate-binding protein [Variovorax sp. H27-G14]|uniref:amino acid ABC transporter substrate-binding protein n=1 Tax=Variovorax sp. H27-G14 TaxID=3111914 RepID=UPI0038FC0869